MKDYIILILTVFIVGISWADQEKMRESVNEVVSNNSLQNMAQEKLKETKKDNFKYVDSYNQMQTRTWKYNEESNPDQWKYKDIKKEEVKQTQELKESIVSESPKDLYDKNYVEHPKTKDFKFKPAQNVHYFDNGTKILPY
jgi:hypothetical protein